MSKMELYLSKIVKYGLYAILLTPLAFWPRALYGFGTPKFILFQVLVEIVFGAWLILKCWKPSFQQLKSDFNNWLVIALALFIVVSFISAIFGVDFQRSLWGIGARMTGIFAEIHFLAWFLVLISVSKSNFNIKQYLNFSFTIGIFVALTAFYQNAQWHLAPGHTIFGNPTFVAPYFLFHFFWGIYQFFPPGGIPHSGTIFKRWSFGIGTVLIGVALVMGQVRGAIIGLLTGVFVTGAFLIFSDILANKRHKIFIAALMLAIILGITSIFVFKDSEFVKNSAYLERFGEISLSAITAQTRILTWQSAFKGISLLGIGPENFNYLFNAHYNPRLLMYGGNSFAETWQDKPHNAFIEILAETGIIGGLAYIAVWFFAAFYLFGIFKKGNKFLAVILIGSFVSYLAAVFFSFDSFGSWFGLYLFLAFLILS